MKFKIEIPTRVHEILEAEMAAHGDPDLAIEAAQECFETPITNEGMDALTAALDEAVKPWLKFRQIRTLEALAGIVSPNTAESPGQPLWFLSLLEAQTLREAYDRKDIANIFLEGIAPMSERWAEVLASIAPMDKGREWPTEIEIRECADELGWF